MGGLGLTITCAIGAGALGLSAATLPFVLPAFRRVCIPYVPATVKQIENVVKLMDQYKNLNPATRGLKIIDLGSGDGRVVLQLAKAGYTNSTGVELNSLLVLYSRWKSFREGTKKVKFVKADIFKTCLEDYDVIVLFGTETIVPQVRPKLLEMKDGAGLILCRFPLQSEEECWKMTSTEGKGIDQTWLYIRTNIC